MWDMETGDRKFTLWASSAPPLSEMQVCCHFCITIHIHNNNKLIQTCVLSLHWTLLFPTALSSQCSWDILQPCWWQSSPTYSWIWHENQVRLISKLITFEGWWFSRLEGIKACLNPMFAQQSVYKDCVHINVKYFIFESSIFVSIQTI